MPPEPPTWDWFCCDIADTEKFLGKYEAAASTQEPIITGTSKVGACTLHTLDVMMQALGLSCQPGILKLIEADYSTQSDLGVIYHLLGGGGGHLCELFISAVPHACFCVII